MVKPMKFSLMRSCLLVIFSSILQFDTYEVCERDYRAFCDLVLRSNRIE